jgi:hypothetical protein
MRISQKKARLSVYLEPKLLDALPVCLGKTVTTSVPRTSRIAAMETTAKDASALPPEPCGLHVHEIQAENASIYCS